MNAPAIRLARHGELPELLALYRHLNPDDPSADMARAQSAWAALLASPLVRVVVGECGGQLVSSCTLVIVPNVTRGVRPYAFMENVVTDQAFRRRGFARSVVEAALGMAWDAGCYKVMLATGSKNPGTLRFYEGAGFVRGGKTFFEARPCA